jgi:homopolymeric O-antigen transport system ATP-binding protein
MSDIIIRVENISKSYLVGHQAARHERYMVLRDVIAREAKNFGRKAIDFVCGRQIVQGDELEEFWALRDVNFEVKRGEILGVIGRNGAGKSTLLKILSRITEPTKGRVGLRGRVASLLEVGTGFHPELTGRENVFLNGAILGMSRQEVRSKFDEIVAFAEVERFIDTPVKRYSSGMYVRLAFAVAAHLEPEVLIVDEVLAVGDARFQAKCLGKMTDVARQGRTILFVSHNMTAVQSLCDRCVLLQNGQVEYDGSVAACVNSYLHEKALRTQWIRTGDGPPILGFNKIELSLVGSQPEIDLRLEVSFAGQPNGRPALVAFDISNAAGTPLMQAMPSATPFLLDPRNRARFDIALPPLVPGKYWVSAWVGPHHTETFDTCTDCVSFEIEQSPISNRTFPHTPDHGFVVPRCRYEALAPELSV